MAVNKYEQGSRIEYEVEVGRRYGYLDLCLVVYSVVFDICNVELSFRYCSDTRAKLPKYRRRTDWIIIVINRLSAAQKKKQKEEEVVRKTSPGELENPIE